VRAFGLESGYPLVPLISYTPYVAAVSLVVLAACLLLRRWAAAATAGVAALLLVVAVAPRAIGDGEWSRSEARELRVMSSNLLKGRGTPTELVELVRERDVDVLTVQELTPEIAEELDAAGIGKLLPHRVLTPEVGVSGGGIYSSYRTTRRPNLAYLDFTQTRARIRGPGGMHLDVVSVHPVPPTSARAIGTWQAGLDALPSPDEPGLQLLLGDFNATLDHDAFREILDQGYDDAGELTGGGLTPTWPDIPKPFRYLPVTIDHLVCEADSCGTTEYEVLDLEGSDHRPVYAELALAPDD
jgi:endonuclease/exonuclease/phosphatase (EEP) superfamily protein YafD